jgi:hypothetical protein
MPTRDGGFWRVWQSGSVCFSADAASFPRRFPIENTTKALIVEQALAKVRDLKLVADDARMAKNQSRQVSTLRRSVNALWLSVQTSRTLATSALAFYHPPPTTAGWLKKVVESRSRLCYSLALSLSKRSPDALRKEHVLQPEA